MQIIRFNFLFYFLQHVEVLALRYSLRLYRNVALFLSVIGSKWYPN